MLGSAHEHARRQVQRCVRQVVRGDQRAAINGVDDAARTQKWFQRDRADGGSAVLIVQGASAWAPMCGDSVISLTLTGQPGVSDHFHCWRYGVSPGKTGDAVETGGEMSHKRFIRSVFVSAGMFRRMVQRMF